VSSQHDRLARLDASYAMDALDARERAEFEAHLATCGACRAGVAEARQTLDLLAGVDPDALAEEPPPDTLLPGLLRRAARERTRRRVAVAVGAAALAACLAVTLAVFWPSSGSSPRPAASRVAARDFVPLTATPVRANASLVSKAWGTQIDVHCSYAVGVSQPYRYRLRVVDAAGEAETLGSWTVPVGGDISYVAGTSVRLGRIRTVQIVTVDGRPVLELRR